MTLTSHDLKVNVAEDMIKPHKRACPWCEPVPGVRWQNVTMGPGPSVT